MCKNRSNVRIGTDNKKRKIAEYECSAEKRLDEGREAAFIYPNPSSLQAAQARDGSADSPQTSGLRVTSACQGAQTWAANTLSVSRPSHVSGTRHRAEHDSISGAS